MPALVNVALTAFVALVTMVNPFAVIPSFIALTEPGLRDQRGRVALVAGLATTVVLALFLGAGTYVFRFFGITLPAFQIMGGIIFFTNALRTLMEDERRLRLPARKRSIEPAAVEAPDAASIDADPASIAVVPLAIPMLAGPGAITSVMVLVNLYPSLGQKVAILISITLVGLVSSLTLLAAVPLSRIIGERARLIFAKVMALLLGAIGVQFVINGITPLVTEMIR